MFCQTKDMLIIPFTKVMGAAEKQYLKEILKGVDHQLAITGSWLNSEEAAELFNAHQEEIDEFFESFEESSLYQELHESLNNYDYDSAGELLEKFYRLGAQLGYADIKRDLAYTLADKQALFTLQQYNFGLIKSVNDETLQGIKTTLWDSVASGKGYLETARRLRELPLTPLGVEYVGRDGKKRTRLISVRSRSEMIARTEHARAVNTGTLQAYANYGVESVDIITAGDALVCNICLAYEGNNPHTLEEAQKLLPAHPNCRCCYGAHINLNDIPLKPINNAVSVDLTEDDDSFDKSYDEIIPSVEESAEEFTNPANLTKGQAQAILDFHKRHKKHKIEYGNIIDLDTGELFYDTDVRGVKHGVRVHRPSSLKNFGVIHNHPEGGTFSGGDISNMLEHRGQSQCYAITPKGKVHVATITDQAKFQKERPGLSFTDNTIAKYKYGLHKIARETSQELMDKKYRKLFDKCKTREEVNEIRRQMREEFVEIYDKRVYEKYSPGKDLYIEIHEYSLEELEYVIRNSN